MVVMILIFDGRSHLFLGVQLLRQNSHGCRSSLEISLWSTSAWSMRNFTVLWRSLLETKCLPNKKQQKMKGNTGGKDLDVEKPFAFISRYWKKSFVFFWKRFGIRNQCPCNLRKHFGRFVFAINFGHTGSVNWLVGNWGSLLTWKSWPVVSFLHRWAIFLQLSTKKSHVNLSEAESHVSFLRKCRLYQFFSCFFVVY